MPELTRKLRAVAESDDVDAIDALIEAGANPNAKNLAGNTALHAAAYQGSVGAIRALLAAGALRNAKECLRSHCARYRHARRSRRRSRCAARRLRLTMTSIVAATGVASPRPGLHPLFDRVKAWGCTGGRDDWGSGLLVDFERPRANPPRVDVKQREPVPARKGRTRVDVPAIGEVLHLVDHEVPVHQGPKPRDRPAAVAANLILGRIAAKQRNVDMVRGPGLEHGRRDGPIRMRNVRMHEADRTVGGLDRHRDRHAGKNGTPAPVLGAGNTPEPLGPAQRRRAPVRIEPVQERTFVIAHDRGLEAALKPHERLGRVWPAIDQIADPEEAVGNGIKAKLRQRAVQGAKAAVDVANDKIAPARIGANSAGPDTLHGRSTQSKRLAGFRRGRQTRGPVSAAKDHQRQRSNTAPSSPSPRSGGCSAQNGNWS